MSKNPLFNKDFVLLWSGALVSKIGDKFYGIALAWWILQKTKSPMLMGLMMIASILPGLVIGPFAGALIDKWPRKPLIVLPDIVRGIVVVGVAALSSMGMLEVWQVILAAALLSLGSAFFDPTVQAVIPQLVTDDQLPKANALNQMAGGISTVIGPILGGVAVSFLGVTTVFLINGLSYLISGFFEGFLVIPTIDRVEKSQKGMVADLKEGVGYLRDQKNVLIIMGIIGIAHFFVGSLFVVLPFLANTLAGTGVQNLGVLETMLGIGLILGTIAINLKKNDLRESVLFILMTFFGICFIGIGLTQHLGAFGVVPYMVLTGFIGMTIATASVYWQSLLQRNTPHHMAGRIFSLSTMIGNLSMPVAYGVYGFMLNRFSISSLMLLSGIFLAGLSLFLMVNYSGIKAKAQNTLFDRVL